MPESARSGGDFRRYTEDQVQQLHVIRHCRTPDIPVEDIRNLLRFSARLAENCAEINALVDKHIHQVKAQLASIKQLR